MLQNRLEKILVPLDDSLNPKGGLNEAISLTMLGGSKIIEIHVLSTYPKSIGNINIAL